MTDTSNQDGDSWLSQIAKYIGSGFTPDTMTAWGALGGLGAAATPHAGKGLGWGNALVGTAADVAKGGVMGAQAGQQMQAGNIQNQMAQMNLQKQQAIQPLQIRAIQNALNPQPGNLAGMPSSQYYNVIQKPTSADTRFATAYDNAMAFSPDKSVDVMKSWAENTPELKGAIKLAEAQNSVNTTPNGPQFGINGMPGAPAFGSMAPQVTSLAIRDIIGNREPGGIGPGNQQPAEVPTPEGAGMAVPPMNASQLSAPMQGGQPPQPPMPPQMGTQPPIAPVQQGNPLPPVGQTSSIPAFNPFSKVSTEAATKAATDNAANAAEAAKTYNVMTANFPNMMQRIQDMSSANSKASFTPLNDEEGHGIVTKIHDALNDKTAAANAILQQRAAQGVLPELGPALSQAGIKGNKFLEGLANQSNNIDLSKGQVGRQTQIDGLMKAYIQNMKSAHDQLAGIGGNPAPLPPPVIAQAVKYGVMSRPEAEQYLQKNHGFQ